MNRGKAPCKGKQGLIKYVDLRRNMVIKHIFATRSLSNNSVCVCALGTVDGFFWGGIPAFGQENERISFSYAKDLWCSPIEERRRFLLASNLVSCFAPGGLFVLFWIRRRKIKIHMILFSRLNQVSTVNK